MKFAGATIFCRRRSVADIVRYCRCFTTSFAEHVSFIKDVAAISCPEHLPNLLNMLQKRGDFIMSPGDKQGLFPLAIPLSRNTSGVTISLLRWPTASSGMDVPVVQVHKYGVSPLANNVEQYIHRILVEEDASTPKGGNKKLFHASDATGTKLYREGNFTESQMPNVDTYLLRKVGVFPDVVERKINQYLEKGDHMAALVTGEFYTKKQHFPGFGRPAAFNAELLLKVGHDLEAKGAARGALKSPWWTLGYSYQEVAEIAEWKDEQIYYIKTKLTEEGKQDDLNKGKDLNQIALDDAGYWLDLASVEGAWDEFVHRIAECYKDAGLSNMARFITYNG